MAIPSRPEAFTQNFQREVQAMLFLKHWHIISAEELRLNLKKLGMDLIDQPKALPQVPDMNFQLPIDEEQFPIADPLTIDVADEVIDFITENQIPEEIYGRFHPDMFKNIDVFIEALNSVAEMSEESA